MNSLFKALSHPLRRQIVEMLRAGDMTSGKIAAAFDVAWPTVTGHLAALKEAGLVDTIRTGTSVSYCLNISAAEEAVAFLIGLMGSAAPADKAARNEDPA